MATIRFYIKPVKNADTAHIMASFSHGSSTPPTMYLGFSIPSNKVKDEYKYWDKKKQQVRAHASADKINKKITTWKTTFNTYVSDCKLSGTTPNMQYIMQLIDGTYKTKTAGIPTLLSIIASFKDSIKITHSPIAIKAYTVLEHDVTDFQKHTGDTYTIMDIDNAWYKKFVTYLISEENNFNAIINKKQGRIATVIKYAEEDLKHTVNPDYTKKYKLKTVQAPKFPLQPAELATLWAAHATGIPDEKNTRNDTAAAHKEVLPADTTYRLMCLDAFLLATETGLRYSDIIQLKPIHINSQVTPSGLISVIDLTEMKTDDITTMPLSDKAIRIIDRYTTENKHTPLFAFSKSQAVGQILKSIFKKLELTRPCEIIKKQGARTTREIIPLHDVISFHMGRNTYITRLLAAGLAPVHVKDNVGHSKLDITMGYFRNEDVTRFNATLAILNAPTSI